MLKNLPIYVLFFCFHLQSQNALSEKTQKTSLPKITILGTFHFEKTNDLAAIKIDSLNSRARQKQLEELALILAQYKPTKIMVEWEPKTKPGLDEELRNYLADDFNLPKNEIYQIGFRVAKLAGIKELFPIDYQMGLGDEEVMSYLNKTDKLSVFQNRISKVIEFAQEETDYLNNHTFSEYYQRANSTLHDSFNRNLYLEQIAGISKESGNPLWNYAANWYKRNIFIMGQIDALIEDGDRILVIIGGGHRAILKDLYQNRSEVEYVEINSLWD